MRIGVEFSKTDMAKYISHLDLQRAFSRAIRRSGLPIKMSEGFNPHYVVSFASALALGVESEAECVEMALAEYVKPELFAFALGNVMPPGIEIKKAVMLKDKAPKLMAAAMQAEYEVRFKNDVLEMLNSAVCDIMSQSSILAVKKAKGKEKQFDMRPMILSLDVKGETLVMRLASAPSGSLKPEFVIGELEKRVGGLDCSIKRTGLYALENGQPVSLLEFCAEDEV